jgi:hypothetical protein
VFQEAGTVHFTLAVTWPTPVESETVTGKLTPGGVDSCDTVRISDAEGSRNFRRMESGVPATVVVMRGVDGVD